MKNYSGDEVPKKMSNFRVINPLVGMRIQLSLQDNNTYFSKLIGYFIDEEYLIVKTPFENGISIRIQPNDKVNLRGVIGTGIFNLDCYVKSIFRAPYFYLHLGCLSDIKLTNLRTAVRVKVNVPVQINDRAEAGMITDLSVTGASIMTDQAQSWGRSFNWFRVSYKTE